MEENPTQLQQTMTIDLKAGVMSLELLTFNVSNRSCGVDRMD
jgi:hypothetical protein